MPLSTTTIGSYPKPSYAPVPNGFDAELGSWRPTEATELDGTTTAAENEATLDRAVCEVVAEQSAIGIDVPTDGEIRREHYIYYHCRRLEGFDFESLVPRTMRDGGWAAEVPAVSSAIRAGAPFLARDWQIAQAATDRPVKITLPGPLTIAASAHDEFYGDERALSDALADALNVEIRRVAEAGCRWIQIDEPVFAREPERALAFGIDALARCFDGVPREVRRVVHVCCGYPSALDVEDYPKAERDAYFLLADALEAAPIDAVSIEDAHRHNDLRLLERFASSTVILGVVDIARTRVESADEIRSRLRAALEHIDGARLIAAPDCGLAMLDRQVAVAKLRNVVAAAHAG